MKRTNILKQSALFGLLLGLSLAHPSQALSEEKQTAGYACSGTPNTITTTASEAGDDLLACVGGTWRSMIFGSGVPSGAIMAFNLKACPSGWSEVPALAGRTIIGAGTGPGLTPRELYAYGGEEKHTMLLSELVPHTVSMSFGASDKGGKGNGYAYSDRAGGSTVLATYAKTSNSVGGGEAFNVMMPYYALLYCQKD